MSKRVTTEVFSVTMNMSAGVQGDHLNTLNLQHKLELAELRERILEINGFPSRDCVEYKASHSSTRLSLSLIHI